jgi:hypothetical protein
MPMPVSVSGGHRSSRRACGWRAVQAPAEQPLPLFQRIYSCRRPPAYRDGCASPSGGMIAATSRPRWRTRGRVRSPSRRWNGRPLHPTQPAGKRRTEEEATAAQFPGVKSRERARVVGAPQLPVGAGRGNRALRTQLTRVSCYTWSLRAMTWTRPASRARLASRARRCRGAYPPRRASTDTVTSRVSLWFLFFLVVADRCRAGQCRLRGACASS